MVNIGIVGIGFMGMTHYKAMAQVQGGQVAAIVSRDPKKRAGDWNDIQGNFGDSGGMQDLSGIRCYETLDELLADGEIDLVDICLPTNMHVETSVRALAAGKHVLLEKPIALALDDADRIVAVAEEHQRQFMVAHVLRYFPEFRLIKQLVANAEHGPVLAAHFKRIISRPAWWAPEDLERTGGPAIDLHIHDADFVQFLFGMPTAVSAQGYIGRARRSSTSMSTTSMMAQWPSAPKVAGWRNRAVPLSTVMTCTLRRPRSSTTRLGENCRNC